MTRPAIDNEALLYDTVEPSGVTCSTPAIDSTYRRQRVVAVAGVVEHVPGPAGRVVEQLQNGDLRGPRSRRSSCSSGRYVRTGASRSTRPCSTRRMIAVAVNVLPVEPNWNNVCSSTGSGFSTLVTPWKA